MRRGYYFETTTDQTETELGQTLARAGIRVVDARRTTVNNLGIIITETLARGIWNYESGYQNCRHECHGQPRTHTSWDQLSEQQRSAFASRLTQFMENSRIDQFSAMESMGHNSDFDNIALERCDGEE